MTTFSELGVAPDICDALQSVGISEAFPIQEMTLSVALEGSDLIGQARTGTGKTLAFAIPVIQRTTGPDAPESSESGTADKPQALVICPTRELAIQVAGDIETATKGRRTRSLTIYGGVAYEPQLEALDSGVDIVVGTPGRILDLANRGALDLSEVGSLVLDEADEMLDLGFLPDVEAILAKTPAQRQSMLFSATMPGAIVSLARKHMRHPMNIRAESSEDTQLVPTTSQFVWQAHEMDKAEVLARILQADDVGRVIIFTRTKRTAQRATDDLADRGFPASPLHGDMAQSAREKALQRFRDGKIDILVATDVAARGIDVAGITHVINYNCPEDHKTYVHRIGRTGRAGASGIAITFVDWADLSRWKLINSELGLPFDEPQETYSTSDHLFQDLGISRDVKGRLKPSAAASGGSANGSGQNSSGQNGSGQNGSGQKSATRRGSRNRGSAKTDRNRNSNRGHQPQASGAGPNGAPKKEPSKNGPSKNGTAKNGAGQNGQQSADGTSPRRRRNRRRTRGGAAVSKNPQS